MRNDSRVNVGLRADASTITVAPGAQSADVVSKPEETPSSWGSQKTVAVVLGGASLVALGAGIGFGLPASSKKDELESAYDDASRAAAYSTLGIIADHLLKEAGCHRTRSIRGIAPVGIGRRDRPPGK